MAWLGLGLWLGSGPGLGFGFGFGWLLAWLRGQELWRRRRDGTKRGREGAEC